MTLDLLRAKDPLAGRTFGGLGIALQREYARRRRNRNRVWVLATALFVLPGAFAAGTWNGRHSRELPFERAVAAMSRAEPDLRPAAEVRVYSQIDGAIGSFKQLATGDDLAAEHAHFHLANIADAAAKALGELDARRPTVLKRYDPKIRAHLATGHDDALAAGLAAIETLRHRAAESARAGNDASTALGQLAIAAANRLKATADRHAEAYRHCQQTLRKLLDL